MTPLQIIEKTYAEVLPGKFDSAAATVMLLAIGHQESRFVYRQQIRGPARGYWQFELSGISGVLRHPSTSRYAQAACSIRNVLPAVGTVYEALAEDDLLACAFARLLLWTDPALLPGLDTPATAWNYYLRLWRPGKPHRETWDDFYASAVEQVRGPAIISEET